MTRVIFSSWGNKVVDNRGLNADKYASAQNLPFPLQYDGHQVKAFMSWDGLVVADKEVDVVDMARCYLEEAQRLSCGECSVGYIGLKVMTNILSGMSKGKETKESINSLKRISTGIKENAKCDFCASAVTPILDTLNYYEDAYLQSTKGKEAATKSTFITKITAPCMEACPAHQDIPGYIELIKNGRYAEALKLIRETNCFPGVTGRACYAFCEANCCRSDVDSPLAIRTLKRLPADYALASGLEPTVEKKKQAKQKIAVIGAGPAGLAASHNLALNGYKVTIYDEQSAAGGMALIGIPSYRLPNDTLDREIDIIRRLGVEVKLNTRVGKDITLEQLSSEGFKAIFIGTGAHLSRKFDIENWKQGYQGLVDGVEFLRDVNLDKKLAHKDKVMIVGGGNVAIDCARTCLRLGSKDVTIIYRRSRAEMPARKEEVDEAEKEGVNILFLATPVKVLTKGNEVTGAECIRMELGEPDASGRGRPIPVKGSEFVVETDMIISAIGEAPDLSFLSSSQSIKVTEDGNIAVSLPSYQTSAPGVFSGGDCVTGPATLIEAIAAGNRAAKSIDQYLRLGKVTPSDEESIENLLHNTGLSRERKGSMIAKKSRQSPEELPIKDRRQNFDEVEKGFTAESAVQEAKRCLRCYRVMLLATASEK